METKAEYKISNVCTDELTALILEVQDAGYNLAESCQWGTGRMQSTEAAGKARAALREYVEALRTVIAAKEQVIEAKQARIDALESDLRELLE